MSGYPGSLSIPQEVALAQLREKLQLWIDKAKEENKNVSRDQDNEATAAAAAEAVAATEAAAAEELEEEGGGAAKDGDDDAGSADAAAPRADIPRIRKYCSVKEVEERGRQLLADDEALLRFLRSRDFDVKKAYQMCKDDFKWRALVQPEGITAAMIPEGLRQRIMRICGYDREGSPVVMLAPANWEPWKHDLDEYIRTITYSMELIIAALAPSVHQMTVVFDMAGWSFKRHGSSFAMQCTNQLINVVQKHYPTVLKKAFLINVPGIFKVAWKVISPWIDPRTRAKVFFLDGDAVAPTLLELIPKDVLEQKFGGDAPDGGDIFAFDGDERDLARAVVRIRASPDRPVVDLPPPKHQAAVPARGKHFIDVRVGPGHSVEWHAHADGKDCNVRSLYAMVKEVESALAHELELEGLDASLTELSSHDRVGADAVSQRTATFDAHGIFRLEFDNTYSWMNSKKVKYTLRVHRGVAGEAGEADAADGAGGDAEVAAEAAAELPATEE